MMDQLIAQFPEQLLEAIRIGESANLTAAKKPIHNILVTGLGGSGMGADVVIDLLNDQLRIPMLVNKDYSLPAFANENTLLIASSYSGNTEETIMALEQGMKQGAQITCVTSGGKMEKIANENGFDLILLPKNQPSPRACLGYSFVQQLFILKHHGFINDVFVADLKAAAQLLVDEKEVIKAEAEALAKATYDKIPIIYAPDGYGSIAIRWRQQINENGKLLCWHHVIPEMNHNELVGWRTEDDRFAPIFFKADDTFDRTAIRVKINDEIVRKYTKSVYHVHAKGNTRLARMMYLTHIGDWVSYYMAQLRSMDAVEVQVIDFLKGELAKV